MAFLRTSKENEKKKEEIMILEFTNGIFQGKVSNGYNFSKTGIFLWDDSSFLVGEWKQNYLNGKAVYIIPGTYISCFNFIKNELEGLCIVRYMNGQTLISKWTKNKLNGAAYYFNNDNNKWIYFEFSQGKCIKMSILEQTNSNDYNEIFKNHEDYKSFMDESLVDYLKNFHCAEEKDSKKCHLGIFDKNNILFFGYSQDGSANGLGFMINSQTSDFISIGYYKDDKLNGIGREFQNQSLIDGLFKNGDFSKNGNIYNTKSGDCISYGVNKTEPTSFVVKSLEDFNKITKKWRLYQHQKSLHYFNKKFKVEILSCFENEKQLLNFNEKGSSFFGFLHKRKAFYIGSESFKNPQDSNKIDISNQIYLNNSSFVKEIGKHRTPKITFSHRLNQKSTSSDKKSRINSEENNNPKENYQSLDSRVLKKTKSKFFLNNQKKIKNLKDKKNAITLEKREKNWNSNIKLIKDEKKPTKKSPSKPKLNEKKFIYLNVLQSCYKSNPFKKQMKLNHLSKESNSSKNSKTETPLSNQKGTMMEILTSDLFQDLNKNANKETFQRENGSICLNQLVLENVNQVISDDIKEFSPKETFFSTGLALNNENDTNNNIKMEQSLEKINLPPIIENIDIKSTSEISQSNNENINNNSILDRKAMIEANTYIERVNTITNVKTPRDNTNNEDSNFYENSSILDESSELKKKFRKSFVKKIFERKNKKAGTAVIEQSLTNMFINKLMGHSRSNSRGERFPSLSKKQENSNTNDEEEKKMNDFLEIRKSMANSCKITVEDFDAQKNENPLILSNSDKKEEKEHLTKNKKNSNNENDLLEFLDKELNK